MSDGIEKLQKYAFGMKPRRCDDILLLADQIQREHVSELQATEAWNARAERTCHNLYCEGSDLGEGGFRCSRCDGEMYGDEPNYCCHCGAKVVDE